MPRTKNIEYIVDEKGRKKFALMSYKAYRELLEDFADIQSINERRHESADDLETIIADMKNAGRIQS